MLIKFFKLLITHISVTNKLWAILITPKFLEIIEDLSYLPSEKLNHLKIECDEIVKVMTTYKKKLSDSLSK